MYDKKEERTFHRGMIALTIFATSAFILIFILGQSNIRKSTESVVITQIEKNRLICVGPLYSGDVSCALNQVMDQGYIIDHCEAVPDYYRSSIILFVHTKLPEEIKLSMPAP